jgi:hypothetical protein
VYVNELFVEQRYVNDVEDLLDLVLGRRRLRVPEREAVISNVQPMTFKQAHNMPVWLNPVLAALGKINEGSYSEIQ